MKRNGFTLTELPVVIASIGVLASLCVPAMNNPRNKAKVAICSRRLERQVAAVTMYSDDYGKIWGEEWVRADPNLHRSDSAQFGAEYAFYTPGYLTDYLPKGEVHYCPLETKSNTVMPTGQQAPLNKALSKKYMGGIKYWPHYRISSRWLDRNIDGDELCSCHPTPVEMKRKRWLHYLFRDMDYGAHSAVKWRDAGNVSLEEKVKSTHHNVAFNDGHVEAIEGTIEGSYIRWYASDGY
jgi:prepilin-type processing-associated H-X9-DG protein